MTDKPSERNPGHIRKLFLRNFRGVKKSAWIPLRPLTFLVGPNSSGKSSLVDPLMLIAQSELVAISPATPIPRWSGSLVDLGSFDDAVYKHNRNLRIEIGLELTPSLLPVGWGPRQRDSTLAPIRILLRISARSDDVVGRVTLMKVEDCLTGCAADIRFEPQLTLEVRGLEIRFSKESQQRAFRVNEWLSEEIDRALEQNPPKRGHGAAWRRIKTAIVSPQIERFLRESQRVSSGRAPPHRWYAAADAVAREIFWRPRIFDAVDPAMIAEIGADDMHYPLSYMGRKKRKPRGRLDDVLERLNIASQVDEHALSPYHRAIQVKDNVTGVTSSLIDVGYGASQVIPVIHGCLSAASGPLFIEQPEIHLHPKAQGVIAELLASASLRRQVFVETHSVHMINRVRVMILEGRISHDDVMVLYVDRDTNGTHVTPIPLDASSNFTREWPTGFFDERYQDTMRLLQLKSDDAHED